MSKLQGKEFELQRKNQELEDRRKQIQLELEQIGQIDQHDYDQHDTQIQQVSPKAQDDSDAPKQDILAQIQAVKRNEEERKQAEVSQLKKTMEGNKLKVAKNRQKLQRIEQNIEQAESALRMKNDLKRELESKGKKISEESRKWIGDVSRLNDRSEQLKAILATELKEQEAVKSAIANLEKKLQEIIKEKASYEAEQKGIAGRGDAIKQEIEAAKGMLREKEIAAKEDNVQSSKNREKVMLQQKRLQRQKGELLKAYKKLGQYIALLRKANSHLQTANSLDFTLKEYLQAIDRTDIIL